MDVSPKGLALHRKPRLVMFAGPNGSGKSTITPSFQAQPGFPSNYINPDEIAKSLGGDIMERAYEASAITANYRDECIRNGESFAFETQSQRLKPRLAALCLLCRLHEPS